MIAASDNTGLQYRENIAKPITFAAMKTELIIFDMDGVLIDSEPYWNDALKVGFRAAGLEMTDEMCEATMGARLNEVVDYRFKKHQIIGISAEEVESLILEEIIQLVKTKAGILPGVLSAIEKIKMSGIPMAIASSSPMRLINEVMEKLKIEHQLSGIFSAQDDQWGKPHPSVYLRTAKTLNAAPENCWVIEDSVNGMISAKAAKMNVIAVPDPKMFDDKRWGLADILLHSLDEFEGDLLKTG
jgi:sugar-phosphatase